MQTALIALVLSLALVCQGAPDHPGPPNDVSLLYEVHAKLSCRL